MLSFITGKILIKRANYLMVMANGLGYKIFVTPALLSTLGETAELYLYQQIKEDSQALYGFLTLAELEFFELLLSVSGIGPKSALAILAMAEVGEIKEAIVLGDHGLLTKVSGIGAKTAQRLVLELKNKIDYLAPTANAMSAAGRGEELEALVALGYSLVAAREALSQVNLEVTDSAERIKAALRQLGR